MKKQLVILFYFLIVTQFCTSQIPINSIGGGGVPKYYYREGTIFLSAVNVTMTTFNIINFNNPDKSKSNAGFGILTGCLQLVYGGIYKDKCPEANRKAYYTLNMSIGLITLLSSSLRLINNKSKKSHLTTMNLTCIPYKANNFSLGVSIIRKI